MEENKSNREKIEKIKNIIEAEIEKELINKQNEVTDISEKIKSVLKNLDLLKYIVAVNYYDQNQTLTQKKPGQEDEVEEEKVQTQIHPCVKKLMPFRSNYNKSFGDLLLNHSYETRNSKKTNFSESITENKKYENCSQEKSSSYNNSTLKMPQYIPPLPNEDETVGSVNSTRGGMSKESYRVIVGNISKWIPPDTREDNSTHKWMVYIRSKDPNRDVTQLLKKVRYFLHESYKPHDIIDVTSPPFRLTRRGWGEFPIRVQLHFIHPLNKPVDIIHNLKLDMSCSGVQMLGGETVIEVHLHQNSQSMANGKEISKSVKTESRKEETVKEKQDVFDGSLLTSVNGIQGNHDLDIKKENEVSETVIKQEPEEIYENVKLFNSKMEEMSEALNNSRKFLLDRRKTMKIIEIEHNYLKTEENFDRVTNNFTNSILKLETGKNLEKTFKNGAALNSWSQPGSKKNQERMLRVDISNRNRSEEEIFKKLKMAANKMETESQSKYSLKNFRHMYFVNVVQRAQESQIKTVEGLIKWFAQRWPIVTKLALDPAYKTVHPYSSPSEEEFFRHNIGKQRSAEWFRAKAIQKVLKSLKPVVPIEEEIWSTKQILLWSRFHGYTPSYPQKNPKVEAKENEAQNKRLKTNESSSESEEESFDFPSKKTKIFEDKFLNGLNLSEKKKNQKKYKRKGIVEEGMEKIKNYGECNTCSEANDSCRFGADRFHVLQPSNFPDEIEVVLVDEKPVHESPSKKKGVSLSVFTTPAGEMLFNRFVCDTAKQIGVKIVEEETIYGVKTDSVSRVLGQCASSFLEELLRRSFAQAWIRNGERCPESLEVNDILATLIEHHHFDIFTNRGLGVQNSEKS